MKSSARSILFRYFGTVALILSLLSLGLYSSLRRSRANLMGFSACVTPTAVIVSMNKLAIFLANPAISEAPAKFSGIQ